MSCVSAMGGGWTTWLLLGGMVLLFIVMFFFSAKKRKKEEAEYKEKMDALVPGVKILTIGGLVGEIVEISEKYVVIATGTEENKSYITLDRRGISGPIEETTAQETVAEEPVAQEKDEQESQEEVVLDQGEIPTETQTTEYTEE